MFHILVIDDDAAARVILQRTLEKHGYQVSLAADGEAGVEAAIQLQPALIICDWMMPRLDGIGVCHKIKADPLLSSTFFILLTIRDSTEDRVQGLDAGADDFLSKPIQMSELRARVRAGLRIHQLNQTLQTKNQSLETLTQDLQTQKQLLEAEFNEAAAYVRSLLPQPLNGSVKIRSRFIPSRQLGGDSFDYYWLDPDYLAIYLLDVSGHGLGAALPSVSVMNMLRSQSLPDVNFYQPNLVLDALNETFQMTEQNERYFTIWYGVYNQEKHQLVYASAGHAPAILISGTGENLAVKQLRTPSLPIGMLPDARFTNAYCTVDASSKLYVFSDGVYEIYQADGEMLGLPAFIEMLQTTYRHTGASLDQLLQTLQGISQETTFMDDVSLLEVDFDPQPTFDED